VPLDGARVWTGTGVGGERLVKGRAAKSLFLKFSASRATGISDDTVSNRGVVVAGCVEKNSFKYLENCSKGPS
jgi:hypothetical protein